jgi:hypothetical protein
MAKTIVIDTEVKGVDKAISDIDKIDTLITELPPGDPLLQSYIEKGVRIL